MQSNCEELKTWIATQGKKRLARDDIVWDATHGKKRRARDDIVWSATHGKKRLVRDDGEILRIMELSLFVVVSDYSELTK